MSKVFWRNVVVVGALSLSPIVPAQSRPLAVDLAVTFTTERAKVASSDCGCFWLQGGSADGAVTFFRGLGVAVNFTGEHRSNVGPGVDLSKLAFMAGPRYTWNARHWRHHGQDGRHEASVFGEALFGIAHGFDSVFPTASAVSSSANSFSMQVGGGLNVALARGFGLRALEVDYVRTTLPNGAGNVQNDLRLAFGISYHSGRWATRR